MTNNIPKCFLDSNIWLYFFIEEENNQKLQIAQSLVREYCQFLSTQVVNEVIKNMVFKFCVPKPEVEKVVEFFYSRYPIIEFNKDIIIKALELRERYQFTKYWDALIVSTALSCGAATLFSEDMHDGLLIEKKLRIVNPFISLKETGSRET